MTDLLLVNNDISVTAEGDIVLATDKITLARQYLQIRLRTLLREWFLDQTQGIDWINILSQKNNRVLVDTVIQRTIVDTEFVTRIVSYETSQETGSYRYLVDFTAEVEGGELITITDLQVG